MCCHWWVALFFALSVSISLILCHTNVVFNFICPDSPRHPTRRIFPLDCHAIFIIFAILSVVCICLPLVYYETDEEMMRAREEQKAALYQCQSEKSSRDERDANMSLLQHHDNSNSSHHNSKTYGSISQV